jgi:uncharacterized protein
VLFNVSQLLQESPGAERSYTIREAIPGVDEDAPPADVAGRVRLQRTNRGVFAHAEIDALVRDACGRCLGPAETPVHLTIEEEFLPTLDVHTGQPVARPAGDDAAFSIDEHHHLDLTEAVRQALVVEEPMQPLCRPDCAGLCGRCGADLNQGPCACPAEIPDDRWAALRGLTISET